MRRIIAFDIDGMLTKDEGMDVYKSLESEKSDSELIVGIVSSRRMNKIQKFIDQNSLDPDFIRSSRLKGIALMNLQSKWEADQKIYYGSWIKDRVQASIAGWEYKTI